MPRPPARYHLAAWLLVLGLTAPATAPALDVTGVLPFSIGLPEVNAVLRPAAGAAPYTGQDTVGDPYTNLRMIYDTGASGVVLFENQALQLGVPLADDGGTAVTFEDVGVGGSTTYRVSEALHMSLGHFTREPPPDYPDRSDADYPRQYPDVRLQVGPPGSGSNNLGQSSLSGIAGMPVMAGKVSVINPRPAELALSTLDPENTVRTYVYDPAAAPAAGPGVPATHRHVALSFKSFERFTEVTPAGATGPTLAANPFIGPDPLATLEGQSPLPDSPPGITVSLAGRDATGSFLLDTGNQTTSISRAMAAELNVRYALGTAGTATPVLEIFDPGDPGAAGTPLPDQFTAELAGTGGTVTVAGFYLDALLLRTREGDPAAANDPRHLNFLQAPVFVQDIALEDPATGEGFVFDGIFGTNYLMASFADPLGLLRGDIRSGPFDWLVLDEPGGTLGLTVAAIPLPGGLPLLLCAIAALAIAPKKRGR